MAIQLEDLVARLRLDTSGVASGLNSVSGSLSSVGSKATSAGRNLSVGVTAPLVGIGIAATNLAAGFDKTMRQVAIATGGPSKALSDLAMQMGAETAFSAGEAADAMLELAKGGMTAAQIEGGALAATMKLASAGGVGLAEASTYVSNSMAAFGLAAKDADSVTVALAGAANASSASVESLGMGLSQAAASAKNAGLSLQETTGVLSLFDSVGLKGSDAGTSLKSMLNSLIPTTTKAKDAMAQANLDFVDAEGNFVSVANMAEQLKRGLGGLGEAQRAQALETIFGSDGMRAASALMTGGADAVRKFTQASKDQKTTTELANAAMEGTSGAIERAKGSIETAALTLGQTLAPAVERLAGYVERGANAFTMLPGPIKQGVVIGGALLAVLGPLLVAFGAIAASLSAVTGLFAASAPAVAATGAAASASVAPFLLVAGALVGLAAGFVILYQRSESFRNVVQAGVAQVVTAFAGLRAAVLPIVTQIVGVVRSQMPAIQQTVASVFGAVKSIVSSVMSIVSSVIRIATAVIRQVWMTFGDTILSTISRVLSALLQVVRGGFQILQGLFRTVAAVLKGDWSGAWDGIKQIVSGAGQVIVGLVKGAFALVRGAFSALGDIIGSLARSGWTAVVETFGKGATDALNKVKELPGKIRGAFSGAITMLSGIGSDIVQGLVNGIQSAAGRVLDAAQSLVDNIPGPIRKLMGIASPSKVMAEIGRFIGAGLVKGLSDSQSGVVEKMNKLVDLLREAKRKKLAQLATETKAQLIPLAQELEGIRKKIADVQAFKTQLSENVEATGSFSNVRARTDEEGNELPITAADVLAAKQGAAARAEEFAQVLEQLRLAGLSQPQLDELARSGPQMLEVARATLAGGAEAIAALNAYQSRIITAGRVIAETGAVNMFGAGVDVSNGLIAGLESMEDKVAQQMRKIAKRMIRELRQELKMKSPSRVMMGLGEDTGMGYALGLDDTARAVSKASGRLASAALIEAPRWSNPSLATAAARRAAAASAAAVTPVLQARVFIGDRELTDIVDVQIGDTLAPLRTMTRQGAL